VVVGRGGREEGEGERKEGCCGILQEWEKGEKEMLRKSERWKKGMGRCPM